MRQEPRKEDREGCSNNGSTLLPCLGELRRSRGMTQQQLAELAKVSTGTVYRLENELRGAYPATVRKLASALGVLPVDLIRGLRRE